MECGNMFMASNTYKNLQRAFDGEAGASTKYAIYGRKAREEGYVQIANIFEEASMNEQEHAELFMKLMKGGEISSTLDNLVDSYSGENEEWTNRYIGFAREARKEGYPEIGELFEGAAGVERHHDARFRKLASNIVNGTVFCKNKNVMWICLNCGNLYYSDCAPDPCPVCGYPRGYYQLSCDNF